MERDVKAEKMGAERQKKRGQEREIKEMDDQVRLTYDPESKKVGTLIKMSIKTECKDLQILFNLRSIEYNSN